MDINAVLENKFNGKKIILLGAGVSNTPLVGFLASKGASIEIRDKKDKSDMASEAVAAFEAAGASFVTGEGYLSGMDADFIFRSPGFRPDIPEIAEAVRGGAVLTSEMDLFTELRPAFLFGVTGSDGKSTTTTLIFKMLEKAYGGTGRDVFLGGNIGFPLLDRIGSMDESSFVSCEMSSFQLMTVKTPVDVAVITNVSPNHLNWHTGMDEYIEAKANILKGARRAVLNFGCDVTRELGKRCSCPVTYFSKNPISPNDIEEKDSFVCLDGNDIVKYCRKSGERRVIMSRSDILLPGLHNVENYMTAAAAVDGFVSDEDIVSVARTFGGVKHRFELVRVLDGVRFYNSSIDSSPSRTAAALSNITDRPIILICGGYDKNIPFAPLADAISHHGNVKCVIVTGATAPKILDAFSSCEDFPRDKTDVIHVSDFKDAVLKAASSAESGDVVILSPACASFDAFPNFEVRGDFFKQIVNEL